MKGLNEKLNLMTSTAKVRTNEDPFISFDLRNGKKAYKCRAEAKADIDAFIKIANTHIMQWYCNRWVDDDNNTYPDIEFTFSSDLSIEIMKLILNGLDDCHVMTETLQPYEKYTGEREN
jgi:pantothenate kinase